MKVNDLAAHAVSGWRATLSLRFAEEQGRTLARDRLHTGPLRLLKVLYPEGDAVAHAVIVHPPAGLVAGDRLHIESEIGANAHAVITTPGAQKWYRSDAGLKIISDKNAAICAAGIDENAGLEPAPAVAHTTLRIADGGVLEWLPQEAIVYDGCVGEQSIQFDCARDAKLIAWEMLMWGRRARGEAFTRGSFTQDIELRRDNQRAWHERAHVRGGASILSSPAGYGNFSSSGSMWCIGFVSDTDANAARDAIRAHIATLNNTLIAGATHIDGVGIMIKAVTNDIEALRTLFVHCRKIVRPILCMRAAQALRIWQT